MTFNLCVSCAHDLNFPYHHREAASARLAAISNFIEQNGYDAEFFLSGRAIEFLENKIAALFGKPAALWCPTGTMAQGIAARIYADDAGKKKNTVAPDLAFAPA